MQKLFCMAGCLVALMGAPGQAKSLLVFAGAAAKPPLEEIAKLYEQKYGVKVECTFGGSGTLLSQMILARRGDVYIPGSDDFMDTAEKKGAVAKGKRKLVCYLMASICVQKGNPKGIRRLEDLARPGLRVGIAQPEAVCLGDVALEVFRITGLKEKIWPNIVTQAASCEQTATILKLKQVDAVIGWDVFAKWHPDDIQILPLPKAAQRWRYIPAAVTKFATDPVEAQRFVNFVCSKTGKAIFKKYGYTIHLPKQPRKQ